MRWPQRKTRINKLDLLLIFHQHLVLYTENMQHLTKWYSLCHSESSVLSFRQTRNKYKDISLRTWNGLNWMSRQGAVSLKGKRQDYFRSKAGRIFLKQKRASEQQHKTFRSYHGNSKTSSRNSFYFQTFLRTRRNRLKSMHVYDILKPFCSRGIS